MEQLFWFLIGMAATFFASAAFIAWYVRFRGSFTIGPPPEEK